MGRIFLFVIRIIFTSIIFLIGQYASSSLAEERRLALVIGVSEYSHILKLKNTVNDTRLLAGKLRDLGFEVFLVENPNLIQLNSEIKKFAFNSETADVALVYYAGHGIEFAGTNYLIPTDINVSDRAGIIANSVSLDDILLAVDKARQLRIVILDSCRNDPFLDTEQNQTNISSFVLVFSIPFHFSGIAANYRHRSGHALCCINRPCF